AAVWVTGNPEMLSRAIRNLVENAINYSPPGTTVEIVVEDSGVVCVLDEGPGIKEDERELIFQRFWRRDRRRTEGAGLGLSIVQRIADTHTATISIENRPTAGPTFSLSFARTAEPNACSGRASSAPRLCISGGSGALRLRILGLRQPYRKNPREPQEQKIERKKDDEAHVTAELELGDEADGIGGEIAGDHEGDVVGDEDHDEFLIAQYELAPRRGPAPPGRRRGVHFGPQP